jgi:hypothetical protein
MTIAKESIVNILESRLTIALLLASLIMLAASYVALVNNPVFNIVVREDSLEEITTLESDLAVLGSRYIELSNRITLPLAYERGFIDASKEATFVKISEEGSSFSFANNEI